MNAPPPIHAPTETVPTLWAPSLVLAMPGGMGQPAELTLMNAPLGPLVSTGEFVLIPLGLLLAIVLALDMMEPLAATK